MTYRDVQVAEFRSSGSYTGWRLAADRQQQLVLYASAVLNRLDWVLDQVGEGLVSKTVRQGRDGFSQPKQGFRLRLAGNPWYGELWRAMKCKHRVVAGDVEEGGEGLSSNA